MQSDTILSMVTTSVATIRQGNGRCGSGRYSGLAGAAVVNGAVLAGTVPPMVGIALRPFGHLAAWIVWHATRVSLLDDLEDPSPPRRA